MAVNKTLILFSALAGVGGTIGIVYAANPGYIFSPSIEKVMKKMYDEGKGGLEKLGNDESRTDDKKKKEKEGEYLKKWAKDTLCPTYKKEIEPRRAKGEKERKKEKYNDLFGEIEGYCNSQTVRMRDASRSDQSSGDINQSYYTLISLLYGLNSGCESHGNKPPKSTQSKVS